MLNFTNRDLMDFMRRNVSCVCSWPDYIFNSWVTFFRRREGIAVITSGDELVGIGMARPVRRYHDIERRWAWNEDGDFLVLEMISCERPGIVRKLWDLALARFGPRKWVVFGRCEKYGRRRRIYRFETFSRRMIHA